MRLYRSQIETISQNVLAQLVKDGDIELADLQEAELDVQSVLKEYLRLERVVTEEAKDTISRQNLDRGQYGRVRSLVAKNYGFSFGSEGVFWMTNQIIETIMESNHILEVFAEDKILHKKIKHVITQQMKLDDLLDSAARDQLKHLQEGTEKWEIEYKKAIDTLRRKRGLSS